MLGSFKPITDYISGGCFDESVFTREEEQAFGRCFSYLIYFFHVHFLPTNMNKNVFIHNQTQNNKNKIQENIFHLRLHCIAESLFEFQV